MRGRLDAIFAIHAESLLVGSRKFYIGTFNLDSRCANLNTEVGILMDNTLFARQLANSIEVDMLAENSWETSSEFNLDDQPGRRKRLKLWFYSLLPSLLACLKSNRASFLLLYISYQRP